MVRKTLLQLEAAFREEAEKHQMVNTYYYGPEDIVNKFKDAKPFLVRMLSDTTTFVSKTTVRAIIIEVWGETKPDDSDRIVIESEAESILSDIVSNAFNGNLRDQGFLLVPDSDGNLAGSFTATSIAHEKEARLTGWQLSLDIVVADDYNFCTYPST